MSDATALVAHTPKRRHRVPDDLDSKKYKHFWIKIAPPSNATTEILHGTLICEDSDIAIRREAVEFITENSQLLGLDWRVEVWRPKSPEPILTAKGVALLLKQDKPRFPFGGTLIRLSEQVSKDPC